ncbi:NAD(P)H-dependent oxidoreductase [Cupriavidus basilensis]|uniref:NAD(P)H-dependent oxidoreductase n=1 Tax=Cupriavidus basilensis TaxID=68895 RepID=A0A643FJZ7_9BURK|nr:NAD(P)H-dependent oxidoreductase [Cupriavidus basilensis]QOT80932.1 NAD(P)H-dependent oxidoreductase [Cupriavidus basilensis]
MSKTLILLFHPQFGQSRANRALCNAASTLPGVEIADLYALYPDGAIDVDAEVRRLLGAERIVFQFPLQWYATPALLKTWQDAVLTRMFYIAYETEGRALEGKPMLVAATAGNVQQAYGPGGVNLFALAELLRPLQATANRCGLPWSAPFLLYEAGKLDDQALAAAGKRYVVRLQHIAA